MAGTTAAFINLPPTRSMQVSLRLVHDSANPDRRSRTQVEVHGQSAHCRHRAVAGTVEEWKDFRVVSSAIRASVCTVALSNLSCFEPWEMGDHIAADLFHQALPAVR